jgi:hypothetical protein
MSRSHPTLGRSGIMWHTICVRVVLEHRVESKHSGVCGVVGVWWVLWHRCVLLVTLGVQNAVMNVWRVLRHAMVWFVCC